MNITTAGIPKKGLPEGFVYIDELIDDCVINARYAGTENFMGRAIDGYFQPLVVMTKELAEKCVEVADILRKQGYILRFYDAYRPQRAVDDFWRWGEDIADQRRKPVHYPNVEKASMFELGYIAKESKHTLGSAVDLTIMDMNTHQELDMGTIFDFMDERSHPGAAGLTPEQERNRKILSDAMASVGMIIDPQEWWHFELPEDPYPGTYFDFPIE